MTGFRKPQVGQPAVRQPAVAWIKGHLSAARFRTWKPFLALVITLLGAFFRLYRIDRLPPGETYDPAFYGLDALAILRGERPIFFETNFGREPMFSYLVAACVAVLGVGSPAIHVASAIVGILTVPAVYLAAEEMFADEGGLLGQAGSLVAALALALSFWHLSWSRYGVRAILVPLFAALTIYLLWRAMRTGSRRAFAGCGLCLGLSMYTYQAARLLPILVLLGFAYVSWSRRSLFRADTGHPTPLPPRSGFWRTDLGHLALLMAVTLILIVPLGWHALAHTDSFWKRTGQVSVLGKGGTLSALSRELVKTLLAFSFRGDPQPTVNIPGRPALDPFFSVALALGIGMSLLRIKRPPSFFLLAWLGVMSVPGVLARHGETAKRIIGSLPAVSMLIAVGTLGPLDILHRCTCNAPGQRAGRPRSNVRCIAQSWTNALAAVLLMAVAAGLAYSGVRTYHDYFVVWGQDPALFTHFEAGLAAIGQYIGKRPPGERIYVSPVYVGHPSILYNSRERAGIKGYHGQYCIVLPNRAAHDTSYVIVPGEDRWSLDRLSAYLPQGEIADAGPLHYGRPYFLAYRAPAGAAPQIAPSHALHANWGDQIQLLGYDAVPLPFQPGERLPVTLYYQALSRMDTDYTAFVQLAGPPNPATNTPLWSQDDSEPCRRYRPTSSWDVDEILIDTFALSIPPALPAGEYALIAGFYNWRTFERLPLLNAAGQVAGDHVPLTAIQIGGDKNE